MSSVKLIQLMIIVLYAAITDIKEKKIPNYLFYIGLGSSVLYDLFLCPVTWQQIVLKIIGIIGLFFFGMLHLLGLGDIKLWMILTAYLGVVRSAVIICIACILLILHKVITEKRARILLFLSVCQIVYRQKVKIIEQKSYAFAPYIAVPAMVYCIILLLQ